MTQLEAAALTIVLEAGAGAACASWLQRPTWQVALSFATASLLTHPLAWATNRALAPELAFAPRAAIIEVSVTLLEAVALAVALRLAARPALVASAIANGFSFGCGLLLWWWRTALAN